MDFLARAAEVPLTGAAYVCGVMDGVVMSKEDEEKLGTYEIEMIFVKKDFGIIYSTQFPKVYVFGKLVSVDSGVRLLRGVEFYLISRKEKKALLKKKGWKDFREV